MFGELWYSETVLFGESHSHLQITRMVKARISEKNGNLKEALELLKEVLYEQTAELGNDQEEVRDAKVRIAKLLLKVGDKPSALELLHEVLVSETKELGEGHTKTQNTKMKLSEIGKAGSFSTSSSVVALTLFICAIVYILVWYCRTKIKVD